MTPVKNKSKAEKLRGMGITRDSWTSLITIAAGVLGYLMADGRLPTEWAYGDWLKALSAAVIGFGGTLGTSPLLKSKP